jgi:ribosomal protein L11 methylase PrmA
MVAASPDAGSFRDPSGHVHRVDGRVFRTVMPCAADDFEFVRSTGLVAKLIASGHLIDEAIVDGEPLGATSAGAHCVLEHPRLPFVSYPYEWSYAGLKAAALHHLDVHLAALEHGVTLSDASAYNIQFRGPKPVFIDSLSFRRYRDGEFWLGHRQFCEQFLNPLLLRASLGMAHNGWYRGEMEGISADSLCKVLPTLSKLSPKVMMHVVLQARFQSKSGNQTQAKRAMKQRLPLVAFRQMLQGLRKWISRLEPHGRNKTVWQDYATDNSYSSEEARRKREFIGKFAATRPGAVLMDIGCNTGDYARAAREAGVRTVVGFDSDQNVLDHAFHRAEREELDFLPLFMDAANPSPNQGWAQNEPQGLAQRTQAQALIALALIHHLAIGRNIPLSAAVDWLVDLAPTGIIEFVPKTDPMVQALLQLREDVFGQYSEDEFVRAMRRRTDIVHSETVSASGRRLFQYQRHALHA